MDAQNEVLETIEQAKDAMTVRGCSATRTRRMGSRCPGGAGEGGAGGGRGEGRRARARARQRVRDERQARGVRDQRRRGEWRPAIDANKVILGGSWSWSRRSCCARGREVPRRASPERVAPGDPPAVSAEEEPLAGGIANLGKVVRVGDTVRRPASPFTASAFGRWSTCMLPASMAY